MILRTAKYVLKQSVYYCGLFFLALLAVFLIARYRGGEPPSFTVPVLAALCAAMLVLDVLSAVGAQSAPFSILQKGRKLYLRHGEEIFMTVILDSDAPLTEQDLQRILDDVIAVLDNDKFQ